MIVHSVAFCPSLVGIFLILVLLFNKCEFVSSPIICITDQGLYLLPLILFKNCFPLI